MIPGYPHHCLEHRPRLDRHRVALGGWCIRTRHDAGIGGRRPERPSIRRSAYRDRASQAYYHFTVAQMERGKADRGRDRELRAAIKDDPRHELPLGAALAVAPRTGDMPGRSTALRRRWPSNRPPSRARLTLASSIAGRRSSTMRKRELEQTIALNPDAPEPYLALPS
jgi:hypothetical protein